MAGWLKCGWLNSWPGRGGTGLCDIETGGTRLCHIFQPIYYRAAIVLPTKRTTLQMNVFDSFMERVCVILLPREVAPRRTRRALLASVNPRCRGSVPSAIVTTSAHT